MKKQITFVLPEIDREATKKEVEKVLELYRIYKLSVPEEKLPKVTASYSLEPPAFSNKFHSSTEDAAITNIEMDRIRNAHIKKVSLAINRLKSMERAIIIKRYLNTEDNYDYQVFSEMNLTERTYRRYKSRAFYNLAFALGVEVYKDIEIMK